MRIHTALSITVLASFALLAQAQDSIEARASAQLARETAAKHAASKAAEPPAATRAANLAPPPERLTQLDLVAIKGFAGRLEAIVAVNGRRATATLRTPLLPEGWSLATIGPECAEVRKGGAKPETRTLCFIAPAPPPFGGSATATAAAPSGPMPPLPPGVPLTR